MGSVADVLCSLLERVYSDILFLCLSIFFSLIWGVPVLNVCVGVCECMCIGEYRCLWRTEEGIRSLGDRATDSHKSPNMGAGTLNSHPL